MVFTGILKAPKAGEYVFEIASDDGASLINGQKVVEHDGLHGAQLKKERPNSSRESTKYAWSISPMVNPIAFGRVGGTGINSFPALRSEPSGLETKR